MSKLLLLIISVLSGEVSAQCTNNTGCDCDPLVCCWLVSENMPPHTAVGGYEYTGEGIVTYDLAPNPIFSVNETTGIITTQEVIDREGDYSETKLTQSQSLMDNNHCFNLGLSVIVGGTSTVFRVNIQVKDVNDNPPTFSQLSYSISILESQGMNDVVPRVCDQQFRAMLSATDIDEGQNAVIEYHVEGSTLFELADEHVPCVQSKLGIELDRDIPPSSYSFILVAQDSANLSARSEANVTYILLDINDNQPFFENATITLPVKEGLEIGTFIYQFQAHDIDSGTNGESSLTYRLESREVSKFIIDEHSGNLTLAEELDAEAFVSSYMLTVSATDMGATPLAGTVEVIINVEDVNEPAIFQVNDIKSIMEGDKTTTIAIVIVEDIDKTLQNRVNKLSVASGQNMFYIQSLLMLTYSNRYSLEFNGSVDYEREQVIQLVLNLTEEGSPVLYQTISLNISVEDINDNAPTLNVTLFNVVEEDNSLEKGSALIINLAQYTYDADSGANGTIEKYKFVSVSGETGQDLTSDFTSLLSPSGLLDTSGYGIDREKVGNVLTFVINITDKGVPPQSKLNTFTVTVADINDNPPVFPVSNYVFSIREGEEFGTLVDQVLATDPDNGENGTVKFAIHPSSPHFSINETTGVISSTTVFDRERISKYLITIEATDTGMPHTRSQSVSATILITDINDNNPVFDSDTKIFKIDTNFSPEDVIGQVEARDDDTSSPNKLTWYQLQKGPFSSLFSIHNNVSGKITLETALSEGVYAINISAFNPGKEESGDSILVTVAVSRATSNMTVIGIAAGCAVLVILIIIVAVLVLCICLKNRKSKQQLKMNEAHLTLNSMQNSILKIPAVNGIVGRSGRVTFKERVEETHYDEESVINNTKKTIKKESVTKFDNSSRVPRPFDSADSATPLSSFSSSSGSKSGQPDDMVVVDLEISPRRGMNGDINGHCQYDVHSHPRSPVVHIANTGRGGCGREMMEYSQGTSSDGHTSNNDLDDEESMYSDDASIVNTALSRFGNNQTGLNMPYETPSTHSHLDLHRHLPPISHGQHTHSSSLAQLHAHNLAQLANTSGDGARPQYSPPVPSPGHERSLNHTHTHDPLQSFTHSPPSAINHMGGTSKHLHMGMEGGRNYPHPLVMPDAFPRDAADIHRFPIDSYADYGEESTVASTDLDEALGFNIDAEPGIISLTADYEEDVGL